MFTFAALKTTPLVLLLLAAPLPPAFGAESSIHLPEACRAAARAHTDMPMQDMHQGMMKNMEQGMGNKGMGGMSQMSETQQGLHEAMMAMTGPMMQGMRAEDADVAWICAMIPHHQGAIDMARAGLKGADNAESRKMAEETIAAQEKEIAKLTDWVEKYAAKEIMDKEETSPE
jgi:uncharacterized protein (DUF305 family)